MKRVKRRSKKIREFIHSPETRILCRLSGERYKNTFTRARKITYSDLLLMTLNKQGKSTSFEIRDFEIRKKGEKMIEYTDEAYLKQRRHLNPEVFKEMNKIYLQDFYEDKEYIKRKNGYILLGVDGSKEEIPNTLKNKEVFGCTKNHSGENVARALMSGIYDVKNEFYVDVQIDRYNSKEIELAKRNIEKAMEVIGKEKLLIIFDRGYPSIEFMHWLEKKEVKFLMRLKTKDYKKEKEQMIKEDEEIELIYSADRLKYIKKENIELYEELKEIKGKKYRFTKIDIGKDTTEYLISNLEKEEFSSEELKETYWDRWKIEESYNSVKNKLKIESFTGNLPIFIYQDIYAQVFVYNQIHDMLKIANENLTNNNKEKELKLEYKINENKAIGLYKEGYIRIFLIKDYRIREKEFDQLIRDMERYTTAIRENRPAEPRKWNCTNKYRTNHKPSF